MSSVNAAVSPRRQVRSSFVTECDEGAVILFPKINFSFLDSFRRPFSSSQSTRPFWARVAGILPHASRQRKNRRKNESIIEGDVKISGSVRGGSHHHGRGCRDGSGQRLGGNRRSGKPRSRKPGSGLSDE